jgi:hypothetical protein
MVKFPNLHKQHQDSDMQIVQAKAETNQNNIDEK